MESRGERERQVVMADIGGVMSAKKGMDCVQCCPQVAVVKYDSIHDLASEAGENTDDGPGPECREKMTQHMCKCRP